jgi:hypothetical protein
MAAGVEQDDFLSVNYVSRALPKNACAKNPATGGKKKVQASLMTASFQPRIPISMESPSAEYQDYRSTVIRATHVPSAALLKNGLCLVTAFISLFTGSRD